MKKLIFSIFICLIALLALSSCQYIWGLHTCEGEELVALEPTCGEDGEMFIVCNTCFNVMERYSIPATGEHTFGEKIYEDGEFENCDERPYTQSCTTCGLTNTGKGGPEAHIFEIETVPPTGDEKGYKKKVCTVCGFEERINHTAADHKYTGEYYCDISFHWQKCDECGDIGSKEAHDLDIYGICTICRFVTKYTPGVEYEISKDGSYASVVGYTGKFAVVKISEDYEGVPVTHIGKRAFADLSNSLSEVIFPDSITHIEEEAFSFCHELDLTALPPNLEYIGDRAFYYCSDTIITHIPDSVTYLGSGAFYSCYRIKDLTIGDGLTHIGNGAFNGCNNLGTVTLGKNVESVGEMAFYYSGINEIILSDSTTSLGYCAFTFCNRLSKIHIGKSLSDFGNSDINRAGQLTEITLNEENENFTLQNGILYNKDKTKLVLATRTAAGESFTIPEGVTEIGERAFYSVKTLKSITFPDSVRVIGKSSFQSCSALSEINFGEGLEEIGDYAFSGCSAIKDMVFPRNVKTYGTNVFSDTGFVNLVIPDYVTTLGESAFYSCNSLVSVTIGSGLKEIPKKCFDHCVYLQNVVISDGVEVVGNSAFDSCYSLFRVSFGNNVKVIEERAFINCNSIGNIIVGTGLEEIKTDAFNNCTAIRFIYYMGTAEQWESVIIGTGNTEVNYHFRVYEYSETKPEGEGRFWHYDELGNPMKW